MELNKKKLSEFILKYAIYIVLALMILVIIIKDPTFLSISSFTKIGRAHV